MKNQGDREMRGGDAFGIINTPMRGYSFPIPNSALHYMECRAALNPAWFRAHSEAGIFLIFSGKPSKIFLSLWAR